MRLENRVFRYVEFFVGDDLRIDTRGGDDVIDLQSTSILDDLVIRTRLGSDDMVLDTVGVGDDLLVELGDHDDTLELEDVNVLDDATLLLGEGRNEVTVMDTSIGDDLRITGGHTRSGDSILIRSTSTLGIGEFVQFWGPHSIRAFGDRILPRQHRAYGGTRCSDVVSRCLSASSVVPLLCCRFLITTTEDVVLRGPDASEIGT